MAEVTLEFLARQQERILQELTGVRGEQAETRASITVLTEMVLKLARDMVLIKELLGRMDSRISRIEGGSLHE
jgi:hypothetical protein